MEYHEIGERFEYKGVVLEVTTPGYCSDCYFLRICRCGYVLDSLMYCGVNTRNDKRSIMYGVATNANEHQICNDRRYYTREAYIKPKRKRKIESIYDYE